MLAWLLYGFWICTCLCRAASCLCSTTGCACGLPLRGCRGCQPKGVDLERLSNGTAWFRWIMRGERAYDLDYATVYGTVS